MKRPAFALSVCLVLAAGFGCDSAKPKEDPSQPKPSVSKLAELKKTDTKVGTGPELKKGDLAYIVYTGKLENGTVFDSNDKPDANPLVVRVGEPGVIIGWIEGIPGMKVGGERRLEIPAAKGYGAQGGPGGKVPPNADLYFDVKVIDAVRTDEMEIFDVTEIIPGTGAAAQVGDIVTVHYKGTFVNGNRFDSTYERDRPETFKLGNGDVIKGLDAGIVGMRVGGKRKLRLPPDIAYGRGYNMIPPDMLVYFEVELKSVKKG